MGPRQGARPSHSILSGSSWLLINAALLAPLYAATAARGQQALGLVEKFEEQLSSAQRTRFREYDIVFVFMSRSRDPYLNIWGLPPWSICDLQLNITLEMARPQSRVHILTDDDGLLDRARRLAASLPTNALLVADAKPLVPPVRDPFMRIYKHQSVNTRSYAGHCFWRWGMIANYIETLIEQGLRVSRIIVLDADVVPTLPFDHWLSPEVDRDFGGSGKHLVMYVTGAATMWAPDFLKGYWSFIMDLYSDSTRTVEFVLRYHTGILKGAKHCAKVGRSEVIPCNSSMKYEVSDISSIRAYMDLHRDKSYSPQHADPLNESTGERRQAYLEAVGRNPCAAVASVKRLAAGWTLTVGDGPTLESDTQGSNAWYITVPISTRPACFLHFQGRNKVHVERFCEFVKAKVNGSLFLL